MATAALTTAAPGAGRERAVTYLPSELDQRVRTWAALLGLPASHLLARVIAEVTPSRDQLAEMVQRTPGNDGSAGADTPTLRYRIPDHR
jgi:hypothetical protein